MKFKETHARTVAKTLTVRVLFTLSHLLNGFIITGAWIIGAQIAGVATLINMFLFWAHERTWNWFQWNRKPEDDKFFKDGHPRTISKSITWRALITCSNFLIPYFLNKAEVIWSGKGFTTCYPLKNQGNMLLIFANSN